MFIKTTLILFSKTMKEITHLQYAKRKVPGMAGCFLLANEPEIMYSTVEKLYNKRYGRWGNVFFV